MTLWGVGSRLGSTVQPFVPRAPAQRGLYCSFMLDPGLCSSRNVYSTVTTVPIDPITQLLQIPKYPKQHSGALSLSFPFSFTLSGSLSPFPSLLPLLAGEKATDTPYIDGINDAHNRGAHIPAAWISVSVGADQPSFPPFTAPAQTAGASWGFCTTPPGTYSSLQEGAEQLSPVHCHQASERSSMAPNTSLSEPKDGTFLLPKIIFKFYSTGGGY